MALNPDYGESLPHYAVGDALCFKQILFNLLMQSMAGTERGFINISGICAKIKGKDYVNIEIENLKFDMSKAENMRLYKIT